MAVKNYYLAFGAGNPASFSGITPTFTVFRSPGGTTTPPSISELSTTGLYTFQYECLGSIAFVVDGVTATLASDQRYIVGSLDVGDRNNEGISLIAAGTPTLLAGVSTIQSIVGLSSDVIGDSSTTPTTLFGYMKRARAWLEGRATYTISTGVLQTFETTGATTLSSRTIAQSSTQVTKV